MTDPGKLHMLRPGAHPADEPDSDLMGLAQTLSVSHRASRRTEIRPSIIVIAQDPSRYRAPEFDRIDVEWIVMESPLEALDNLLHRGENCAAVLTELELHGKDNGYRVVEAMRTYGYAGPILVVTNRESLATERGLIKRRGATGAVVFRSERMLQMLQAVAAGMMPVAELAQEESNPRGRYAYPPWLATVTKQLARCVGPTAGDVVRKRFAVLHARYRSPPKLMDVVEEVAEVLSQWPDDKVRFIAACNTAESAGA